MENINQDKQIIALCKFQGQVGSIPKTKTAVVPLKSGGKYTYKYADLAEIWDAIRKPLSDNGLAITQIFDYENGQTFLITTLHHISGAYLRSKIPMKSHEKIQEFGSEITYIRRYGLTSILGLVTDEDDDGQIANDAAQKTAYKQSVPLGGNTNHHRPADKAPQTPEMPKKAVPKDSVGKLKYLLLERDMSILRLEEYLLNRSKKSGYTVEQTADAVLQSPDITNKFCEMYSDWIAYVPSTLGSNE